MSDDLSRKVNTLDQIVRGTPDSPGHAGRLYSLEQKWQQAERNDEQIRKMWGWLWSALATALVALVVTALQVFG